MQPPNQPLTCARCGAVVSVGGGRCPQCGNELPAASPSLPPASVPRLAPGVAALREEEQRRSRKNLLIGVAMTVTALLIVAALLLFLLPRGAEEAPAGADPGVVAAAGSSSAASDRVENPTYVIPTDLVLEARKKAKSWDADAQLVAVDAGPVVDGHIDLRQGSRLFFEFAKPAGARLGPGAPVSGARLRVEVTESGMKTTEEAGAPALAAADPSCPFPDVWKRVTAAGVPATTRPTLRYARDKARDREVWTVHTDDGDGGTRTERTAVDGFKCTILLR